jgi:nucleotide-binding universal stress UspA family protein
MPFETIVVGSDGSADAAQALRVAIEISSPDTVVHVVSAFDPPSDSAVGQFIATLPLEIRDTHDPTSGAQEVLRAASAEVKGASLAFVDHLVDADAAEAILDVADKVGADLIVVGCRGAGEHGRFRRGSVSDRVAGEATRSILVVQG